jgi:exodeoxyribonuclease-5
VSDYHKLFSKHLGFPPTDGQSRALNMLADFMNDMDIPDVFVLRGYAGTGKTTIVKAIIKGLRKSDEHQLVLMASTGKASKVLSNLSGSGASTIHREIYRVKTRRDGSMNFTLKNNENANTLFVVDEASMISPGSDFEFKKDGKSLMEDLLEYVYGGYRCKLLLIGDEAQLPPVGSELSPALDPAYISDMYGFSVKTTILSDVVRHDALGGILDNATRMRINFVEDKATAFRFALDTYKDVIRIDQQEFADLASGLFSGPSEDAVVICRSNKRTVMLNRYIRERLLGYTEILESGEQLMVVRNNYKCLPEESSLLFVANGEVVTIKRVNNYEEKFGFRFADAEVCISDGEREEIFDTKLLLDTLWSDQPSLSYDDYKKFYSEVFNYHRMNSKSAKKLKEKVMDDPYFNALQIKYSNAVTCHKTQGGQWDSVIIDNYFYPGYVISRDDIRWLYTAFTRAVKKVYLFSYPDSFFQE